MSTLTYEQKLEGVICPHCDQLAQIRQRKIYGTLGKILKAFCDLHTETGKPVHIADVLTRINIKKSSGLDYSVLKFFGLLEPVSKSESKRFRSGLWKPTALGYQFVAGIASVRKYAMIYNNALVKFEGPEVYFATLGNEEFDATEV